MAQHASIDVPTSGATVTPPFTVAGWAIDTAAGAGTGVDWVDVYAYPIVSGGLGTPVYLGRATYGAARADVAAIYGAQFTNCGFTLAAPTVGADSVLLRAFGHSTVDGSTFYVDLTPVALVRGSFPISRAYLGLDVLLSWVELWHVDSAGVATVYPWSGVTLADAPGYYHGLKDGRLLKFGPSERALSDWQGQLQGGGQWSIQLSDTPDASGNCLLRGWMTNAFQRYVTNRMVVVRLISLADYRAGKAPLVVARGVVISTNTVAGSPYVFEFKCAPTLTQLLSSQVPTRTLSSNFFPNLSGTVAIASIFLYPTNEYVVQTVDAHGAKTGDAVVIAGSSADYDKTWTVGRVLDDVTFAIPVQGTPVEPVSGGTVTKVVAAGTGVVEPVVYGDTSLISNGATPVVYIDDVTLAFAPVNPWSRFLVAGHAVKSVDAAYERDSAGIVTPLSANVGFQILLPGGLNWAGYTGDAATYRDVVGTDGVTRRYTFVYASGAGFALRYKAGSSGSVPGVAAAASGTLTLSANANDGDTVTIGSVTYTFQASLVNAANNVHIGGSENATLTNLANALAAGPGSGTDYGAGTVANDAVTAGASGSTLSVLAATTGSSGNSVATTAQSSVASWGGGGTLSGGADATDTPGADLVLDVKGVESAGDGSGGLLSDVTDQYLDVLRNVVLATYLSGARLATPLYDDGGGEVDDASFASAKTKLTAVYGGIVGAGIVNAAIRAADLLALLNLSADVDGGFSKDGAYRVAFASAVGLPAEDVTDENDIIDGTFAVEDRTSEIANDMPYQWGATYVGGSGGWTQTNASKSDASSIANYRQKFDAPGVGLAWVRSAATAAAIMGQRISRQKDAPRYVPIRRGLNGLAREIGDVISITARDGYGPTGFHAEYAQIRSITPEIDLGMVDYVCRMLRANTPATEAIMGDQQLGGLMRTGFGYQANGTYRIPEWRRVKVDWDAIPAGFVVRWYAQCNVEKGTGESVTPVMQRHDGTNVTLSPAATAQTAVLTDAQLAAGSGVQVFTLTPESGTKYYIGCGAIAGATNADVFVFGPLRTEQA